MIIDQNVMINWNNKHKKHYENNGYKFTKLNEPFLVNIEHLLPASKMEIKVKCDYCGNIFITKFCNLKNNDYHACKNCVKIKRKNTMLKIYGVENNMQREEIKLKRNKTNIIKYGGASPMASEAVRNKIKQNCLKKHGVTSYMHLEETKLKIKQTNLKKYGVDNPFKNDEIKKIIREKSNLTMYNNGTGPCSKQQKYIHNLLGGELNYPVGKCLLDIAFLENKIYLEYDGSGHRWWDKKYEKNGEKLAEYKDLKRTKYLNKQGWKLIRYISSKDVLLKDKDIIKIFNFCQDYLLNSNRSWIEINIDKNKIISKELNIDLNNLVG